MTQSSVVSAEGPTGDSASRMPVPPARGPLSAGVIAVLTGAGRPGRPLLQTAQAAGPDVLADDDAQLTLTLLYELHLHGIRDVDDELGWDPELLAVRAELERRLSAALDELIGPVTDPGDVVEALFDVGASDDGPPLSKYMAAKGTIGEFRELVIHRSLNQLREADVHTCAIPRLAGAAKAALIEVQADEYGGGSLEFMHSTLYATLMRGLGLDDGYAHYLDRVPGSTLAALNTLSYFGMHRSRVNELVGHLCVIEMSSSLPSRDYSRALRRLGVDESARVFYDEHVEADSVHEQLVVRQVAGRLGASPDARIGLVRGARACVAVEALAAQRIWDSWQAGRSSLRQRDDQ